MTNRQLVNFIKETYPQGTKVKLIHMDDAQAPPAGTIGTVLCVDDIGTIHVKWDNNSCLGVVWGVDRIVKI